MAQLLQCHVWWWMQRLFFVLLLLTPNPQLTHASTELRSTIIPVYWNSSSETFRNQEIPSVTARFGDSVNMYCPFYGDTNTPQSMWEYYIVYLVSKQSFDSCVINDTNAVRQVLNCTQPSTLIPQIYLIVDFTPVPGSIDFRLNEDYYFITTSFGTQGTVGNMYHGACKEKNMRLILKVRETTDSSDGTSGGDNNSGDNNSNNNNQDTQPTPYPTPKSTITTTTAETTTRRPYTTSSSTSSSNSNSGTGQGGDVNSGGEPVPGSDGFPDEDETAVIHAGGGTGSQSSSNINTAIIDDSKGASDAASHLLSPATGLVLGLSLTLSLGQFPFHRHLQHVIVLGAFLLTCLMQLSMCTSQPVKS